MGSELLKVKIDGEDYFKISQVDEMRAFLMSVVSDSNHWMFIGSNGALSAGRKNSDYALFPYYTDDKIIESAQITGSKTIVRLAQDGNLEVWEPFSVRTKSKYTISRHQY